MAGLKVEMMNQVECKHDWIRGKGDYNIKYAFCIYYPSQENRSTCNTCLKQACASCLKAKNQESRQDLEYEPEDKILSSRVRNLEHMINKLEVEFKELKGKPENKDKYIAQEENASKNTELKDQMVTVKEQKGDRLI